MMAPLTSAAGFPLPTDHGPPRRNPRDGTWLITRHADLQALLRLSADIGPEPHARIARVAQGTRSDLGSLASMTAGALMFRNPPFHGKGRAFLHRVMGLSRRDLSEPAIRPLMQAAIARNLGRDAVDGVRDLCDLVPVQVILSVLGVSNRTGLAVAAHTADMMHACQFGQSGLMVRDLARINGDAGQVLQMIHEDMDHAERTGQGPLARVLAMNRAEFGLSRVEMSGLFVFLAAAGIETTTALLATAVFLLGAHPDLWDQLAADRGLVGPFVEELLRVADPLHTGSVRRVPPGTILGGIEFAGTELLTPMLEMGNHDPEVFPEPHRFRLDRRGPTHLSFGLGHRSCLGAGLARLETRVLVDALLDTARPCLSDPVPHWRPPPSLRRLARLDLYLQPL